MSATARERIGRVYLVGAGPGDPALITLKGRKVLERSDAILQHELASGRLLEFASPAAERISIPKTQSPAKTAAMLIDRARGGSTVALLTPADSFVFGESCDVFESLAAAGIPFEIVPGITAAGIAAYTGVPFGPHISFISGDSIDWSTAAASETIVISGSTNFPAIARELIANGRPASTPAMAVRGATRPDQQTIIGTLADLPAKLGAMNQPATIVVGAAVALRDKFCWFEKLPLFGKRIVVTRDRRQAADLSEPLEALGADVLLLPVIEIRDASDRQPLDSAVARLDSYDWLIFTSANGVRHFVERLDSSSRDLRSLKAKICAIGPATRAAVEALHLKVDKMPEEYVAESLVKAFESEDLNGRRILLPRAAVARDLVPAELRRRGATVDVVEAYRTVLPEDAPSRAREVLEKKPHWITFTSSSTVTNFIQVAQKEALKGIKIASIGPITSATIREHGLKVDAEAKPHTTAALIEALQRS